MEIHEKIKSLRLQKNISQVDMADAAGMSRSAYISFEKNGSENLPLKSAIGIAGKLKTPFNELFEIEANNPPLKEMEEVNANLLKELENCKKWLQDKELIIELLKKQLEKL